MSETNEIYFKIKIRFCNSNNHIEKLKLFSVLASELYLLFVIGTTLQTTLCYRVVTIALHQKIPVIEINSEPIETEEQELALFKEKGADILPKIVKEYEKKIKRFETPSI